MNMKKLLDKGVFNVLISYMAGVVFVLSVLVGEYNISILSAVIVVSEYELHKLKSNEAV